MVCNTPPSLSPSVALPSIPRALGEEDEEKRRELERRREEGEEETYILQFAAIKLCKFAVLRENLSIFAVIKKNVAAITPLGDFDMRPINIINNLNKQDKQELAGVFIDHYIDHQGDNFVSILGQSVKNSKLMVSSTMCLMCAELCICLPHPDRWEVGT